MYYAGIDWADQHHDAVVIDDEGRRVGSIRVEHNARGLAKLMDFLKSMATPDQLAIVVETDRGLLVSTLLESGLAVYPVNPKTVNKRRAPSGAKTDAIDAYMLARTGRSDLRDLRRLAPDDPVVEVVEAADARPGHAHTEPDAPRQPPRSSGRLAILIPPRSRARSEPSWASPSSRRVLRSCGRSLC